MNPRIQEITRFSVNNRRITMKNKPKRRKDCLIKLKSRIMAGYMVHPFICRFYLDFNSISFRALEFGLEMFECWLKRIKGDSFWAVQNCPATSNSRDCTRRKKGRRTDELLYNENRLRYYWKCSSNMKVKGKAFGANKHHSDSFIYLILFFFFCFSFLISFWILNGYISALSYMCPIIWCY